MNLNTRQQGEELLDAPEIERAQLWQNLRELDLINRLLGGHAATLKGLKSLITDKSKTYLIADLGCGGGDTLKVIHQWAKKNNFKVKLLGIDSRPETIEYAKKATQGLPITFHCGDIFDIDAYPEKPDVLVATLVMHHFFGKDLNRFIWLLSDYCKVGYVINDLHRNPLAYYSIKWLTRMFPSSKLVKHDAPLSVARGFWKLELEQLLKTNQSIAFQINWIWAFRWLVVGRKK